MKKQIIYAGNTSEFTKLAEEAIANGAEKVMVLTCDCQWYSDGKPSSAANFFDRNPVNSFKFHILETLRTRVSTEDLEIQIQEAIRRTEMNQFSVVAMHELCDFFPDNMERDYYRNVYAHVIKFFETLESNGYEWIDNGYKKWR